MNQLLPPVMILGCGRSGTSIFGELFNYIADYRYSSEPPFKAVMESDLLTPLAFKVPHESEEFPPDSGLSFPLKPLQEKAPDMRWFWIVRHPLDAICSLRVGISKNWGHHPRPPDWRSWLDRPLIERCAHHWAFLNSTGYETVAEISAVVQFETMILDPGQFLQIICQELGIEPGLLTARAGEWIKRVQNENNADFVEAETSRAYSRSDHGARVGRWRENLSVADVDLVLPIVAGIADSFGYDLSRDLAP